MFYKPHEYQVFGTNHILKNHFCGLFMQMGLGKTVCTLTAIKTMLETGEVKKVLVIAPKKVAENTWTDEIENWDHLRHLTTSKILGTEKQRRAALKVEANIYIINRENVAWLVSGYQMKFPFDMIVIDELSSFKSSKSVRFKALRKVRPLVNRLVGLTGTPAPNGLLDLWSQLYLIDQGERLGKTITSYREKYFNPTQRNGPVVYKYAMKQELEDIEFLGVDYYEKEILNKISDLCISMKAKDYLQLPDRVDRDKWVVLPPEILKKYNLFEKDLVMQIANEEEITAVNAAALTNKLQQFANGAIYDAEKNWHEVHTEKLQALEEDIEAANSEPVLVFYGYKHDLARIQKSFKVYKPVLLQTSEDMKKWNRGQIQLMMAHPASAGHGLNLQHGGSILSWFGIPWGLELYEQAVARVDRQGQTKPVTNSRILTRGTIDEDIAKALAGKASKQDAVMAAVKARIRKYAA